MLKDTWGTWVLWCSRLLYNLSSFDIHLLFWYVCYWCLHQPRPKCFLFSILMISSSQTHPWYSTMRFNRDGMNLKRMLKCFSEQQGRRECSTADTTHQQAPTVMQASATKPQRKSDQMHWIVDIIVKFICLNQLILLILKITTDYRTQVSLGFDLWVRLSLTNWLTEEPFWNLTDLTLADEDTNSILTDNANSAFQGNLVAKFGTNASSTIWWPNLELMQVAPSCGQICN